MRCPGKMREFPVDGHSLECDPECAKLVWARGGDVGYCADAVAAMSDLDRSYLGLGTPGHNLVANSVRLGR